jgi:hypothetical protein
MFRLEKSFWTEQPEKIATYVVWCSPLTHPIKWLNWIYFGWTMDGEG